MDVNNHVSYTTYHTFAILALTDGKLYDMVSLAICVENNCAYVVGYYSWCNVR
jgi:hypothetical protein